MNGPEMTHQLGYIIASVNRRLEDELAERLRPGGVPIEQFRILEALAQRTECTMGELAQLVLVEPATLTKIIDRMVAEQLVFRAPDPRDRRRVRILTAPAGKALWKRLSGVSKAQEARIAELLDAPRAEALRSLLRELMDR
jgi:MarR family transcriptional regulator, organic hydroperoxide resistance regulator